MKRPARPERAPEPQPETAEVEGPVRTAPHDLARRVAGLALEKKGEAVVILDLRELTAACDYFVLASGLSELQVKAMAEHIDATLAAEGIRPWHVEGRQHRRWVLLDYVDVVVHLFHRETRDFYRLENLWADAPREDVAEGPAAAGGEASRGPAESTGGSEVRQEE